MRVLVTGGAGFIGSSVAEYYATRGDHVVVLDSLTYAADKNNIEDLDVEFVKGRLHDGAGISDFFTRQKRFDLVIHCAAESSVDRSIQGHAEFIQSNVLGSSNLFWQCVKTEVPRVINFGTDEIFGHVSKGSEAVFVESDPFQPRNIYSASKASQVHMAQAFHYTHKLDVVTICPSNTYGLRQHPEKLIPKCVLSALDISYPSVPLYGGGDNIREWTFVADVVDAVALLVKKGKAGEVYNVGSGEHRDVISVVKAVEDCLGVPVRCSAVDRRKGEDFAYRVDASKIRNLGWTPKTKWSDGIVHTVSWFKNNKKWLDRAWARL